MKTIENENISMPTLVYFNDDHTDTQKCTDKVSSVIRTKYSLISTWKELAHELEKGAEILAFHIDMIMRTNSSIPEFMDMINVLEKCVTKDGSPKLKIGVIINPQTQLSSIRLLQKTSVTGILLDLNFYSLDEAATGINALLNGIPYWPKHIINALPGAVKKQPSPSGINLTARQEQVYNLIRERGASNKVIAKILGISESTVKLHVTETLKKCGVRNRTQLAVFSH